MATLGARVDDGMMEQVAKAAMAAGMKVSNFLVEAVKDKLAAGTPKVNSRQLNLLNPEDRVRLSVQREAVKKLMLDGEWRSLPDIAAGIKASDASIPSISARLRDLRKAQYGGHTIDKRQPAPGYFEYRLVPGGVQ